MDFSILYRVVWMPSRVFKQFLGKIRLEPFIIIGVIVIISIINAYIGRFGEITKHPFLLIAALTQSCLFTLLLPLMYAFLTILIVRYFFKKDTIGFLAMLSLFILCNLPYYIEFILLTFTPYPSISLGSIITIFGNAKPFIFGMFAAVTPFFLWAVILWVFAFRQIFNLKIWQRIILIATLIFTNMILGGLLSTLKCYMS